MYKRQSNSSFNLDPSNSLLLNGITVLGAGSITAAVDNSGNISLQNALTLSGAAFTLALDGTGEVFLISNTITASAANETLKNNGDLISTSGTGTTQIGNGNDDLTLDNASGTIETVNAIPVSYTHLDVYKRQLLPRWLG